MCYLRKCEKIRKHVIDGWDLVHVGLAAARELSPSAWISSFNRVNLNPQTRVPFPEWCKKIAHFLQGGDSFKPETITPDSFAMLPSFWQGMLPTDRKRCVQILEDHGNSFSVACLRQIHTQVHVALDQMHNLRVCLDLAREHPDHLERDLGAPSTQIPLAEAVVAAKEAKTCVAAGLQTFELHPTQGGKRILSGIPHFDHMLRLAKRSTKRDEECVPSPYLDVAITAQQRRLLDPTPQDFAMQEIMSHMLMEAALSRRWQSASLMLWAVCVASVGLRTTQSV